MACNSAGISPNHISNFNNGERTAFNEQEVAGNDIVIEGAGIYNLVPANFREFTSISGSTGTQNRMMNVSTGTSVGGYGAIQSFRSLTHRAGRGSSCRFSGYFQTNVDDSWQGMGLISIGEEMSFGYNGTVFGIWNRYGGLPEVRTITVTGASGGTSNLTLTLNSVTYTIPLTVGTTAHNAYEISNWLNNSSNQSVWTSDQVGSTVIISALSDGAKDGTYTFSHETATGTIAQNTAGVTKTSDFIPQVTTEGFSDSWNGDKLDFPFDPSKGNLYQVKYQNMGFGSILYYVMSPLSHKYINVHTIYVPNQGIISKVPNPSMRCGFYAVSIGSTTNLQVYTSAFAALVEGVGQSTRNPRSRENTQTLNTTDETNVLTIRNRKTYNYLSNQVDIKPLSISVANECNKTVIFRVRAATDTGVEQNFTAAGTNLVSDIDITNITITTGTILTSIIVAPGGDKIRDLQQFSIVIPPSLNFIITAQRIGSGAAGDVVASVDWNEDI